MDPLLAFAGLVQLLAAASFTYVGAALRLRSTSNGEAGAVVAFVAWWWGMAAVLGIRGLLALSSLAVTPSVSLVLGIRFLEIPILCAAAWGIAYYVGYLYTGRAWLKRALGAYYAVAGIAFAVSQSAAHATIVVVDAFGVTVDPRPPGIDVVYGLFAVPLLTATIAYLTLLTRVREPAKRYRIALTGTSLLAWVLGGLVASVGGDSGAVFVGVTGLGLVTAAAVLLAYRPPGFVLIRLDPAGLDAVRAREQAETRRHELRERVEMLI